LSIPEISVFVQSTLSPITLPTAYKLTDKIVEWNKIKHIRQGWNVVAHPTFLDPSVFGHYLTEYTDKLVDSASRLDNSYVNYLEGFAVQIKSSEVNKEQMKELRDYLDELDVRRKQNWRGIYPWMDEIFIKELGPK